MPSPSSLALLVPLVLLAAAAAAPADTLFPLSVVHLNDFHARFEQAAPNGGACAKGKEATCVGGIARVVTEVRRQLAERPNTLLLNAGDNFQGTLWYTFYGWNVTAAFLNRLPWDAFVLGNHEFDRQLEGVIPFIEALNAPVVMSNLDDSKEPSFQGLTKKSVVVERDGRKIGIIGIITATTKVSSFPEKLEFTSEGPAVAAEGARLKEEGVDIIVVLSHAGIETDLGVAATDPYVDLIVGGHSHTLLYTGKPPGGEIPYNEYPIVLRQASGRKVAVVQAFFASLYLGNMTAFFDSNGELVSAEGNPIYLDKDVTPDPETLAALAPWASGVEEAGSRRVGYSSVLLDYAQHACFRGECNLGSFVADAFVHSYEGRGEPGSWTRAAVALIAAGDLRTPIAPGNVTFNDVKTMLPFENSVDVMEVRGDSLRRVLEQSVSRERPPRQDAQYRSYYAFLQMSGLRVIYDTTLPVGQRVLDVAVLCRACAERRYTPLKDDEWYPVALNSFLAAGGDNYTMFPMEGRNREVGQLDTEVLLEYLKVQNPIVQERDDRIIFLNNE